MRDETRAAIHAMRKAAARQRLEIEVRSNRLYPGRNPSRTRGPDGFTRAGISDYLPGDKVQNINWPASACTGLQHMVKDERFEPRRATIYALVCVDPSMDFSLSGPIAAPSVDFEAGKTTMRGMAAYLLSAIMLAAGDQFDFALACYSKSRRGPVLKPQPAPRVFDLALATVLEQTGETDTVGGGGLQEALRLLPREPSLVFVLSDFVELLAEDKGTQDDCQALQLAGRQHTLRLVQLYDPVVEKLALLSGIISLQDMTTGEVVEPILTSANRHRYQQQLADCQRRLDQLLHGSRTRSEIFRADGDFKAWSQPLKRLLRS